MLLWPLRSETLKLLDGGIQAEAEGFPVQRLMYHKCMMSAVPASDS